MFVSCVSEYWREKSWSPLCVCDYPGHTYFMMVFFLNQINQCAGSIIKSTHHFRTWKDDGWHVKRKKHWRRKDVFSEGISSRKNKKCLENKNSNECIVPYAYSSYVCVCAYYVYFIIQLCCTISCLSQKTKKTKMLVR